MNFGISRFQLLGLWYLGLGFGILNDRRNGRISSLTQHQYLEEHYITFSGALANI
jgi:hypothetical protein